jgi:hypothetical protein
VLDYRDTSPAMLSIVDPPAPAPGELMLVFSIDSATYTKLYLHGGNAEEPAYVVSSEGKDSQVVLRSGAGTVIGRFVYPGILGRLSKKSATVAVADGEARPMEQWLELPKAGGREDRPVCLNIGGKEYAWTAHIKDGGKGVYTVCRDVSVMPSSCLILCTAGLRG